MKTIEETFKAEKEILEEFFFKNRVNFILTKQIKFNYLTTQTYISNNIFTSKEYNFNFFKEKVKSFTHYLFSLYILKHRNLENSFGNFNEAPIDFYALDESIEFYLLDETNDENYYKLNKLYFNDVDFQIEQGLKHFINTMMKMEKKNYSKTPLKPFKIMLGLDVCLEENDVIEYDVVITYTETVLHDDEETNYPTILAKPIFKCVDCVICLSTNPDILFCDCGHICICYKCDIVKNLGVCPMCRVRSTIKRIVK